MKFNIIANNRFPNEAPRTYSFPISIEHGTAYINERLTKQGFNSKLVVLNAKGTAKCRVNIFNEKEYVVHSGDFIAVYDKYIGGKMDSSLERYQNLLDLNGYIITSICVAKITDKDVIGVQARL